MICRGWSSLVVMLPICFAVKAETKRNREVDSRGESWQRCGLACAV